MEEPTVKQMVGQMSDSEEEKPGIAEDADQEKADAGKGKCSGEKEYKRADDTTYELFRMVFQAAQNPDEDSKELQKHMTWILTGVLCVQVLWTLVMIPVIAFGRNNITGNSLTFVTLLVSAILAEVVAMAFVVVRFVFRTPLDTMIDLLKDIVAKRKQDC